MYSPKSLTSIQGESDRERGGGGSGPLDLPSGSAYVYKEHLIILPGVYGKEAMGETSDEILKRFSEDVSRPNIRVSHPGATYQI